MYEQVLGKDDARSDVWIARCNQRIDDTLSVLERDRAARFGDYWFGALSHADIAVAWGYRIIAEARPALLAAGDRPALREAAAPYCALMPITPRRRAPR